MEPIKYRYIIVPSLHYLSGEIMKGIRHAIEGQQSPCLNCPPYKFNNCEVVRNVVKQSWDWYVKGN